MPLALSALTVSLSLAGCGDRSPGVVVSQTGFSPLDSASQGDAATGDTAEQPMDTAGLDVPAPDDGATSDAGGLLDSESPDAAGPPDDAASPPEDAAGPPGDAATIDAGGPADVATIDAADVTIDTATTDTGAPCDSPDCIPCSIDADCLGAVPIGGVCQREACVDGVCVLVVLEDACDDGNPCTDDACGPDGECSSTPNEAPCDDGYECTTSDACHEGACAGTLDPAAWAKAAATEPDPCAAVSCNLDTLVGAQLGCVFWTVDLPGFAEPGMDPTPENEPHAIVVTNPFAWEATISLTGPPDAVPTTALVTLPAHATKVIEMPITNAKATGIASKAVRIRSDRPVTVQQFNPWLGEVLQEASLLLPEPVLGTEYVVLSLATVPLSNLPFGPTIPDQVGYFAVVAVQDETVVTVTVAAPTESEDLLLTLGGGDSTTVTLDAGQLLVMGAAPGESLSPTNDLTGSVVEANKPVAVFGGHEEASVADPTSAGEACCAENLEEQLLPTSLLGTDYVAVKSEDRGGEADVWRIVAAEDGVTVDTVPPVQGASPALLAKRGDWIEVAADASFAIHATGKILVGQYLVAADATTTALGDPSLMVAVPTERFATLYSFTIPDTTPQGHVAVTRSPGEAVYVDGALVTAGFESVGDGTWEVANLPLAPGAHEVSGASPFGLTVYGYGPGLSFGHAGGLTVP